MKQLELSLKKRLLIVEYPNEQEAKIDLQTHKAFPESDKKAICLGYELTEEIAKELVDFHSHGTAFKNYKGLWVDRCSTALESFISAIESKGYYWGENPFKDPYTQIEIYGNNSPETTTNYHNDLKKFEENESRTFSPETTLIFEIL